MIDPLLSRDGDARESRIDPLSGEVVPGVKD